MAVSQTLIGKGVESGRTAFCREIGYEKLARLPPDSGPDQSGLAFRAEAPVVADLSDVELVGLDVRARIEAGCVVAVEKAERNIELPGWQKVCLGAPRGVRVPELKHHCDISKSKAWTGLRPVSPSGTPIIGEIRVQGLWINAGHGHLGWTLSCGSGRVIADLINGRDPGIPLPPSQGVFARRAA